MPICVPLNGPRPPVRWARKGSTYWRVHGPSTSSPHRPKTTLGTAAPISTAVESGADTRLDVPKARARAHPMPMGTANSMAMNVVSSVPTMNTSAP